MAAPKGNKFWKLRSKHGRDKLFASPELLLEAAYEYFEWCDKNPWQKNEAVKSGNMAGSIIKVPTQRPFSLSGLCNYLGCNQGYFYEFKTNCDKGFSDIITRIEELIEIQQFEGATVGAFNANIIARKLGLSDKQEITGKDGSPLNSPPTIILNNLIPESRFASSETEILDSIDDE
ncbi:DNA-packaging protein [Dysgonomonas sp. Marseille-P4677]|uniref:DNA-packaging protein n=1 Tax=Dysgonomonas sp. Marseille-P4677 TaxID=2364790 RepID=UPI0019124801|nr:DNA-packaging protein [Dysgonomonas sp. Marseille-P4677]MBK5721409.1 DNA-packaging protein [Dysgonomonas sp. Marseille-P4677]